MAEFVRRLFPCCVTVATSTMVAAQSYNWIRNPDNGHHYALTAPLTWQAAEAAAIAVGGHLATIRSQTENAWLVNTFGISSSKWIGFNDIAVEGTWVWSSGESPAYTNWCSGEPNNAFGNEDGGLLGECLPFGWSDRSVTELRKAVIEVSGPPCRILPASMGCYPGVDGSVYAFTHWDPDGPTGPSPVLLVIGGSFTVAGSTAAHNIAAHDPVSGAWTRLGSGMNDRVAALTVLANGELVAAGDFTVAGGVVVNRVARWSATTGTWSALGLGLNDSVVALTTLPNGQLVAGGYFTNAGNVPGVDYLARWDPAVGAWSAIGAVNSRVLALTTLSNGDLVAGGTFSAVGSVLANRIARRNSAGVWSPIGSPANGVNDAVLALHALPNLGFVAAGDFTTAGSIPARRVAAWSGTTNSWLALGLGVDNGRVYGVISLASGGIVVGGTFTSVSGGLNANRVAAWNGTAWSSLASGTDGGVNALTTIPVTGELVVGGTFTQAGSRTANNIARWNGVAWSTMCTGVDDQVLALAETGNGTVVAGGRFAAAGTYGARHVAAWNGFDWTPFGSGTDDTVRALAVLTNGDIVAGGDFLFAGGIVLPGIPVNYVARWNGAWGQLGSGMNNRVHALKAVGSGQVIAGGDFTLAGGVGANHIARWTGSAWQALGSGTNGPVYALATLTNGSVIAGGDFTTAGGIPANHIAVWNGTSWSSFTSGVNDTVYALTTLDDGSVVVGGRFTIAGGAAANRVAKWNGTAWSPLDTGVTAPYPGVAVYALTKLANGHVVVGGAFTEAGPYFGADHIARWAGSSWTLMLGTSHFVRALLTRANGELVLGGDFVTTGDGFSGQSVSPHAARMITTCPGLAIPFGTPCPGLYGEVYLTALSLPFIGSTFRARAASYGFNLAVTGFSRLSPPLPLSSILPQGVPGCDVLVSPDILTLLLASNSAATSQIAIPNSIHLAGAQFHHQMLLFDGALPAFTDVVSTDGLTLTIGAM